MDHLRKSCYNLKDSRGQGFEDSSAMLKTLIKSLENKHLNPGILESSNPFLQLNGRRTLFICHSFQGRIEQMRTTIMLLLTVIVITISACSKGSLNRAVYDTLWNIQEQKCQRNPETECPERESYENYQRQRQELETSR